MGFKSFKFEKNGTKMGIEPVKDSIPIQKISFFACFSFISQQ